MGKTLVIVESPAKAKTIGRYLGSSYTLLASVGHVRDLPASSLGVDVKKNFKPTYIIMRGKDKVVKELKQEAQQADAILIATDPDREGEAIAWHLATLLKLDPLSHCRITFNEITQKAVQEAVQNPRAIDLDLVDAQQARRILDRLVGYELSPLLWKKIKKGLSAGRVQSVATRMIVEREEEIEKFVPKEYWPLTVEAKTKQNKYFFLRYQGLVNSAKRDEKVLATKEDAEACKKELDSGSYEVIQIQKKKHKRRGKAPFTTSTLQQDASTRLGFSSKKTMMVAQQLYEGIDLGEFGQNALVTYIRTDSVRSSAEAVTEIRKAILETYGPDYLPERPLSYKNKNAAQDAHEAIRPAHFEFPPQKIQPYLSREQFLLYRLIWERFLASQMQAAELASTSVDVQNGRHLLHATGEIILFPGYLRAYKDLDELEKNAEEKAQTQLPELELHEILEGKVTKLEQKFTQPKSRYNEASLIKAMEKAGIGRPSTYAPTVSTILERHYAEKENKALIPTQLGRVVTDLLRDNFNDLINVDFTSEMEKKLDEVEEKHCPWVEVLSAFYTPFHQRIEEAGEKIEKVEMPVTKTGEICPECGSELLIKEGRYGPFISCSQFPTCKFTKAIEKEAGSHCPLCGGTLLVRKSRKGSSFYVCKKDGSDPECAFISWDLPIDQSSCTSCGSYLVWKRFRKSVFRSCSNPSCPTHEKATRKKTKKKGEEEA